MSNRRSVDCYIDCWEGSYREILAPGVLQERYAAHNYPFARRVLTINNVDDRRKVLRLVDAAIERGELDAYVEVAEALPAALKTCGLCLDDIKPVLHFVDFHLVTVASAQADYVLHIAGDVQLSHPFDWVSEAVAQLGQNDEYLIANPSFAAHNGLIEKESLRFQAPYWIGYGFSDQCFLGSTRRLAGPIYSEWNFMSNRYPMAHMGRIFEARVDAYMRNHELLRLTDSRLNYVHENEGANHAHGTVWSRTKHTPLRLAASLRWRMSGRRLVV